MNKKIKLDLSIDDLLNDYFYDKLKIKQNDILFELTSKTRKTGGEKAFKNVYSNQSGEVLLENEKLKQPDFNYDSKLTNRPNCLLWVLSGQVYNIPLKSNIQIKKELNDTFKYDSKKRFTLKMSFLVKKTFKIIILYM